MGSDPALDAVVAAVRAGLAICLIAQLITTWPVLRGTTVPVRRRRSAAIGAWGCVGAVILFLLAGFRPGVLEYLVLIGILVTSVTILLRVHTVSTT